MTDRIRRMPKVAASLLALMLAIPAGNALGEQTSTSSSAEFQIPAENLADALNKFGKQTGMQVVYAPDLARGVKSRALSGKLTVDAALQRLLEGTGLTWDYVNSTTVILKKANTTGGVTPADQMRVAELEAEKKKGNSPESADSSDSGRNQMTVQGEREKPKPFSDANVDLPRTINDEQPYYIFDRETLQRSGAFSVEEFLKYRLSMNTNAVSNSQTVSKFGSTSKFDLRGLGADKTLVLINGRRSAGITVLNNQAANAEEFGQTDVNGIPLSAIDRIEVLPSSASGIYGGSALGGVINVVLKRDYSGGDLRVTYGDTWDAVSPQRGVSGTYGTSFEGGRTHLMLAGQWSETTPIFFMDRTDLYQRNLMAIRGNIPNFLVASTTLLFGVQPNLRTSPAGGILVLDDGTSLGTGIAHLPSGITQNTSRPELYAALRQGAGTYDTRMANSTTAPDGLRRPFGTNAEVRSARLNLSRSMSRNIEAFAELSYSENNSHSVYNPMPRSVTVSGDAPTNPFTGNISITLPITWDVPHVTRSNLRAATLGMQADLPAQWVGHFDITRSESRHSYSYHSEPGNLVIDPFFSGAINPFVSPEYYDIDAILELMPLYEATGKFQLDVMTLRASGPLFELPSGTPHLTFGLERRISTTPGVTLPQARENFSGTYFRTTYFTKKQTTDSLYVETEIPLVQARRFPLLHSLDLQLTGRGERYTVDAGTGGMTELLTNPPSITYSGVTRNGQPYFDQDTYHSIDKTIGLKYQPIEQLILRASLGTAFLPPAPYQLIMNPLPTNGYVVDPLHPDHGVDRGDPLGLSTPIQTFGGGSPDLKPQNSRNINAGVIWSPTGALRGLRLNLEYYRIQQFDAISSLSLNQLVAMEDQFPGRVIRDAQGFITTVKNGPVNLFSLETRGWDINLGYTWETSMGSFSLNAMNTLIKSLKTQYSLTSPAYDAAGHAPGDGGAPDSKGSMALLWEHGPWQAGWAATYVSSYKQYGAVGSPIWSQNFAAMGPATYQQFYGQIIRAQGSDTVPSQSYHDVFVGHSFAPGAPSWLQGVKLQLTISNLLDKAPPLDANNSSTFYGSSWGNIRLRSFQFSATKNF